MSATLYTLRIDDTAAHSTLDLVWVEIYIVLITRVKESCYIFQSAAALLKLKRVLLSETKIREIYRHCMEEMFVLGRLISRQHQLLSTGFPLDYLRNFDFKSFKSN